MNIRIAIAEDNERLARSLVQKLAFFAGIELRMQAKDGADLLAQVNANPQVDLVLMDIEMPVLDGIEATRQIKQRFPQIKVVMLTVFDADDKVFQAIVAGADGYLLKDEPPHKLEESIRMVMQDGAPMSASIAAKTLRLLRQPLPASTEAQPEFGLSQRETEILEQLCKGLGYNQIAENLIISPFTVRKHIENIYSKLKVHNKAEAIQTANRHRLI